MTTLNWLHIIIISSALTSAVSEKRYTNLSEENCNLGLNYKLEELGNNEYNIIINSTEKGELKYYFMDKDRKLLNYDFTSSKHTVRKPGKYYCLVMKSKICHMDMEIKISGS